MPEEHPHLPPLSFASGRQCPLPPFPLIIRAKFFVASAPLSPSPLPQSSHVAPRFASQARSRFPSAIHSSAAYPQPPLPPLPQLLVSLRQFSQPWCSHASPSAFPSAIHSSSAFPQPPLPPLPQLLLAYSLIIAARLIAPILPTLVFARFRERIASAIHSSSAFPQPPAAAASPAATASHCANPPQPWCSHASRAPCHIAIRHPQQLGLPTAPAAATRLSLRQSSPTLVFARLPSALPLPSAIHSSSAFPQPPLPPLPQLLLLLIAPIPTLVFARSRAPCHIAIRHPQQLGLPQPPLPPLPQLLLASHCANPPQPWCSHTSLSASSRCSHASRAPCHCHPAATRLSLRQPPNLGFHCRPPSKQLGLPAAPAAAAPPAVSRSVLTRPHILRQALRPSLQVCPPAVASAVVLVLVPSLSICPQCCCCCCCCFGPFFRRLCCCCRAAFALGVPRRRVRCRCCCVSSSLPA